MSLRTRVLRVQGGPAAVYLAVRLTGVAVLALMRGGSPVPDLQAWDGDWLLAIARYGYGGVPADHLDAFGNHTAQTALGFFPGYPTLVGVLAPLVGLTVAGLGVSLVAGVVAAYGVARLATLVPGGSPRAGLLLVALFAAAPMGIVLSMTYTEALFCAFVAWGLAHLLERHWIGAGLCAAGAGLVRPAALALVAAVALAALVPIVGSVWSARRPATARRSSRREATPTPPDATGARAHPGSALASAVRARFHATTRRTGEVAVTGARAVSRGAVAVPAGSAAGESTTHGVVGPRAGRRRPAHAVIARHATGRGGVLRARLQPWLGGILATSGLLGYLGYVAVLTGHLDGWSQIQRDGWGWYFDGGAATLRFLSAALARGSQLFDLAAVVALLGSLVLLALAIRTRLPCPLVAYSAILLLMVWGTSGLDDARLRLLVPAFPLLVPVAIGLANRRTGTAVAVVVGVALASAWYGGYALTIWRYGI